MAKTLKLGQSAVEENAMPEEKPGPWEPAPSPNAESPVASSEHDQDRSSPQWARPGLSATVTGHIGMWLQKITEAATFASRINTADAWQTVGAAVGVMSEITRTLAVIGEAKQTAMHLAKTADEAERTAEKAAMSASEARDRLVELAAIVHEAEQAAEQLAQTARQADRTAQEAARAAAEAKDRYLQLEAAVAQASEVNSAAAWDDTWRRVSGQTVASAATAGETQQDGGASA